MSVRWNRLLTAATLAAILLLAWVPRFDQLALAQVDAGWVRALASFAAARALNAVLSVAQGTELALQPAGVGLTLTPGQVLDPVNDLVEQFSTLMLFASAAFGVQRVLIDIGAWWPVSLLLSLAAGAWALRRWQGRAAPRWLVQGLAVLLLLRFLVPGVVLASEGVFQLFLKAEYQTGQQTLEQSSDEVARISSPPPADESAGDRLRRWWSQNADVGARFDALKAEANRAVEQVIRLIVVFTLQTVLLPLLLGWGLWRLLRALVAGRSPPAPR